LQTTLLDLEVGSLVVHVDYGIAIFNGLVHKIIGDIEADFLELQYEIKNYYTFLLVGLIKFKNMWVVILYCHDYLL